MNAQHRNCPILRAWWPIIIINNHWRMRCKIQAVTQNHFHSWVLWSINFIIRENVKMSKNTCMPSRRRSHGDWWGTIWSHQQSAYASRKRTIGMRHFTIIINMIRSSFDSTWAYFPWSNELAVQDTSSLAADRWQNLAVSFLNFVQRICNKSVVNRQNRMWLSVAYIFIYENRMSLWIPQDSKIPDCIA